MKRLILLAAIVFGVVVSAAAQKGEGYQFTDKKVVKTVPITNQYRSGTCWCFSTLSFLEEEVLAAGGVKWKKTALHGGLRDFVRQ